MSERETVDEVLLEERQKHRPWALQADVLDRIEAALKAERAQAEWDCTVPLTPEQVRAGLPLLVDWSHEPEWVHWIQVLLMWNERGKHSVEIPQNAAVVTTLQRPAPQWVPKPGERVKAWDGDRRDSYVVGRFERYEPAYGYKVSFAIGHVGWFEHIQPLPEEDAE